MVQKTLEDVTREFNAHIRNLYRMNATGGVKDLRYYRELGAILAPGDIIRIEPFKSFGYKQVKQVLQPSLLPGETFNIATKWTSALIKLPTSGAAAPLTLSTTKLDVNNDEIGIWKILCLDSGFEVDVAQPQENKLFADRESRRLSYGNTTYHYLRSEWGAVPEVFTISNRTPLKFTAYSTDVDDDQYNVRIRALGMKYTIEDVLIPSYKDSRDLYPGTKMIFNVGDPYVNN